MEVMKSACFLVGTFFLVKNSSRNVERESKPLTSLETGHSIMKLRICTCVEGMKISINLYAELIAETKEEEALFQRNKAVKKFVHQSGRF